jgi:hypothetical protein
MNNLLSYCGLVDAKIRASNKDFGKLLWTENLNLADSGVPNKRGALITVLVGGFLRN